MAMANRITSEPVLEVVDTLNNALTASVRPLFLLDEDKRRWTPLASCVLVGIDGVKFVFTAGHVMRSTLNRAPVALATPTGRLVSFEKWAGIFAAPSPGQDLDVGFARIENQSLGALEDCHFLAEDERQFVHEDDRSSQSFYMLIGYPGSRGLTKIWDREIKQRSFCICTRPAPEQRYEDLSIPAKNQMLLEYNERSVTRDGARFNMWKLQGMSGGGVFHVRKETRQAQLVAILTEHRRESKCIIATRVNCAVLLAAIYKAIPGLPELLRTRPARPWQA